jgi:hypothetical protein
MRLLPAPMAVRIGSVAVAAAIAVAGGTAAASAAVPGSAGHSKQPQHQVGGAAKQRYQQRSGASPSPSASASPTPSASSAVVKIATALSIGVTGEVAHKQRIRAVIDGRLFEPAEGDHGVRGKLVFLLRQGANGNWFVVGQEITGPHGGVAFPVHAFKSATFRLAFRGTPHFTGAVSTAETIS